MTPAIFGLEGTTLSADERDFFKESEPFGFILFGRNAEQRRQLRALTDDLRSLTGRDQLPILIDKNRQLVPSGKRAQVIGQRA